METKIVDDRRDSIEELLIQIRNELVAIRVGLSDRSRIINNEEPIVDPPHQRISPKQLIRTSRGLIKLIEKKNYEVSRLLHEAPKPEEVK